VLDGVLGLGWWTE